MVKMGTIWDRTTEVLGGRAGMLFGIAALTLVLPAILRAALALAVPAMTPAGTLVGMIAGIAAALVSLIGQLAIIAASSDPSIDAAAGYRLAIRRLPAAIGVAIVISLAATLLMLPAVAALVAAHVDMAQLNTPGAMANISGGLASFIGIYGLVLLVVLILVAARLTVLNPVVLHERLGTGAIMRSWQLTRGLTWRIVGVLILFIVVAFIASFAAQMVVGTIAALIFGRDAVVVGLSVGIVGALLSALFTVVALAFTAQLYVALAGPPKIAA